MSKVLYTRLDDKIIGDRRRGWRIERVMNNDMPFLLELISRGEYVPSPAANRTIDSYTDDHIRDLVTVKDEEAYLS